MSWQFFFRLVWFGLFLLVCIKETQPELLQYEQNLSIMLQNVVILVTNL